MSRYTNVRTVAFIMNRFGDITEREIDESVPKNTIDLNIGEILVSSFLYFYSKNILPKYHFCLKINRIISIQACCLISLVL
jgi:hypothetical protein